MFNQTIDEAMQKASFSQKFINEMVCPAMRVDYGQGVNINGFVGERFTRGKRGVLQVTPYALGFLLSGLGRCWQQPIYSLLQNNCSYCSAAPSLAGLLGYSGKRAIAC